MIDNYMANEIAMSKILFWATVVVGILAFALPLIQYTRVYLPRIIKNLFIWFYEEIPMYFKGLMYFVGVLLMVQDRNPDLNKYGVALFSSLCVYGILALFKLFNEGFPAWQPPARERGINTIKTHYSLLNWVECCSCEEEIVREIVWKVELIYPLKAIPYETLFICKRCAPNRNLVDRFFSEDEYFALKDAKVKTTKKALCEVDDYDYNWMRDM